MMQKRFIYAMPPTDWFFPFKTLKQVLQEAIEEYDNTEDYCSISSILEEVDRAKKDFGKHTNWEGDADIYISGLPSGDGDSCPLILIMMKQSNNGSTFLSSPVPLPHLEEYLRN